VMTQLTPSSEQVTAVLTSHLATGENFDGAILIGIYPGQKDEIWIRAHGVTINVQLPDVEDLCKQLRRAKKMAGEQEADGG
jgi:hypothetical protein